MVAGVSSVRAASGVANSSSRLGRSSSPRAAFCHLVLRQPGIVVRADGVARNHRRRRRVGSSASEEFSDTARRGAAARSNNR